MPGWAWLLVEALVLIGVFFYALITQSRFQFHNSGRRSNVGRALVIWAIPLIVARLLPAPIVSLWPATVWSLTALVRPLEWLYYAGICLLILSIPFTVRDVILRRRQRAAGHRTQLINVNDDTVWPPPPKSG